MRATHPMSRRAFAKATGTAVVAAAGGLIGNAPNLLAGETGGHSTDEHGGKWIDTNVTLGRWPFRRLALDETPALVKKLRSEGVSQAWAGSFDGLFHKDIAAVNARLAEECRGNGHGLLMPFGSINLALPGWEDDLRRCVETHRMPGVRLHPGYHGYKLDDPALGRLLDMARERRLIVQIVADMEDERTQHPQFRVPHPDFKPLPAVLKAHPNSPVMLLNWFRAVNMPLVKELADAGVLFDIATLEGVGGVEHLVERVSAKRVVFGSHAPFFYFEAAVLKLKESGLAPEAERYVCAGNAGRLVLGI